MKIALLLGEITEQRLHERIDKLMKSHDEQTGCLRKSGNRTAIFTFIAGAVIGVVSNIVVAAWMG